jgi:hypothetical protein
MAGPAMMLVRPRTAELLLHRLDAGPLADHQRGGRVPQVVQPQLLRQQIGSAVRVQLGDGLVEG